MRPGISDWAQVHGRNAISWTEKCGEKLYGYKAHAKIAAKSNLIKKCVVTAVSKHDSKPTKQLVDESDIGNQKIICKFGPLYFRILLK